jgi:hypothetical protein
LALTVLLGACSEPSADLVFTNGGVYTVDSAQPRAEAVAVRDGRIALVGSNYDVAPLIGLDTRVIDLTGRLLIPGFHDTHVHPVTGGVELSECNLNEAQSREEVVRIVSACAARDADAAWVLGGGFQLPIFPRGSPSRSLMDSLIPDRPAYLTSADGHSAWVNSRALELAAVDRSTPDPPEGRIERDRETGEPSGTLRETAMGLVGRHVPPYTVEAYHEGLLRGLALAAQFGITTFHEASANETILRAYAAADAAGELTARVIVSLRVDAAEGTEQVPRLAELRDQYRGEMLRPDAAKIFLDGVIEGQTAALLEPYTDRTDYQGELNFHPDTLTALVHTLDSAGFKVHVHAIGDRAIRVAFDAFEQQHERDGGAGPRHIMAHIQLFDPADIPRFAELGVVASFQPLWAYEDTYITDLTVPRLGPERSRWLYPIQSVMKTGAMVAAGSDWSVTSMNPLRAMEVAVTRQDPDVENGVSWLPEERVSLEQILEAYTMGGALASDHANLTGSIAVGKAADLVVLDRDIFEMPPDALSDAEVVSTFLNGREIFRREP